MNPDTDKTESLKEAADREICEEEAQERLRQIGAAERRAARARFAGTLPDFPETHDLTMAEVQARNARARVSPYIAPSPSPMTLYRPDGALASEAPLRVDDRVQDLERRLELRQTDLDELSRVNAQLAQEARDAARERDAAVRELQLLQQGSGIAAKPATGDVAPPFEPRYEDVAGQRIGFCQTACTHFRAYQGSSISGACTAPGIQSRGSDRFAVCVPWLVFDKQQAAANRAVALQQCQRAQTERDLARESLIAKTAL